ncbi:MAG: FixH family protein [Flavobacteriales bacterium]|jgi:hypothetical protein
MNWGWKITAVYITFVVGMLTLVFKASSERVDLVSKDYYAQELAYSERLAAQRNITTLSSKPTITLTAGELNITFPDECRAAQACKIELYCPANAANDKQFDVVASAALSIPLNEMAKGIYIAKLSFTIGDQAYYMEQAIEYV